ncbi:hypothetical protein F5Y14DRAFT_457112 [Nemania sp. NC0429]|nr:hypothetical protein F5Y14DRAFT_457112 [Nemania sp. NC0429]
MSGQQQPANNSATGNTHLNRFVSYSQSNALGITQEQQQSRGHAGAFPSTSHPYSAMHGFPNHIIDPLEMEVSRQRGIINDIQRVISAEGRGFVANAQTDELVPKGFTAQAVRTDAELHETKQALGQKIQECDAIKERLQAATEELGHLRTSKQFFRVSDTEVLAKFKQLQYKIENLAKTFLSGIITPEKLEEKKELLKSVSPLYREFLNTRGRAHLFFQSLIWRYISPKILEDSTMIWGRNVSHAVKTLLHFQPNSVEEAHAWRAQTGEILQAGAGVSEEAKLSFRNTLHAQIVEFIPSQAMSDRNQVEIVNRSLSSIIDKTFEIAAIKNQSRCRYRCGGLQSNRPFASWLTENVEECDAPQADLIISPVLVRFGSLSGQNPTESIILAKARICCLIPHTREVKEEIHTREVKEER